MPQPGSATDTELACCTPNTGRVEKIVGIEGVVERAWWEHHQQPSFLLWATIDYILYQFIRGLLCTLVAGSTCRAWGWNPRPTQTAGKFEPVVDRHVPTLMPDDSPTEPATNREW